MAEQLKTMSELSMLTILIEAAATIKNRDGDRSLHGYVGTHGLASRRAMESDEVKVQSAVLESEGAREYPVDCQNWLSVFNDDDNQKISQGAT